MSKDRPEPLAQFERSDERESFECIAWKDGGCSFILTGDSSQSHQWDLSPPEIQELIALLQRAGGGNAE